MDNFAIVDAHHHFWDLERNYHPWLCDEPMIPFRYGDYSAIRKTFMPNDYFTEVGDHHVVMTVTMEGEWDPDDPLGESRWMQEVAEQYGFPHAHVAHIRLDRDDVENVLAAQAAIPLVRSVRHKPRAAASPQHVEPGVPGSMGDPRWRRGFSLLDRFGVHFDLQTPWWHFAEALELAESFPDTLVILNHTGLPADRSPEGLAAWRSAMKLLSVAPNVFVKISGLGLAGRPWRLDDNTPIIRETIEIFGVDRCMFASNYPVDAVITDLETIFTGFKQAVADFPLEDRKKLFHDNAVSVYRLSKEESHLSATAHHDPAA
ncbi:thioesterase [candidate division KSB3 bacterium]|uniref:Thioesterase n=1 Tax=candidate division KSB3 bacterium TaxID=2044937 RepID=A0A2G6E1C2_9BACT|nr:MAG: thioesterase [candidate division KSB3 bacterium]PIE28460.1 MAG: thioesterase [candidate division KSB3 bacterium]